MMSEVGFAEQDENCLYAGGRCLLKVSLVGDIEVDVIINIDPMRSGLWCAVGAEDTKVRGIGYRRCEMWMMVPMH
jgi:hypothetical protein